MIVVAGFLLIKLLSTFCCSTHARMMCFMVVSKQHNGWSMGVLARILVIKCFCDSCFVYEMFLKSGSINAVQVLQTPEMKWKRRR